MIGIVDYGAGNLRNVQAALGRLGARERLVSAAGDLTPGLTALILPGVGRFGTAARQLREAGLLRPLREAALGGRPFLGICLGMQLLFESSEEDPAAEGLGVFRTPVRRLATLRLPHIGWAEVEPRRPAQAIFEGLPRAGFFAYFAHSFAVPADHPATEATTDGPPRFASAVSAGTTWGVQFHPEKSGPEGLKVLANFLALAGAEGRA